MEGDRRGTNERDGNKLSSSGYQTQEFDNEELVTVEDDEFGSFDEDSEDSPEEEF